MLLPIKNYPEGYDLTIMNTRYRYPRKNEATGKWGDGSLDLVIKDNNLGTKFVHTINNPTYQYYMAKPNVAIENNELFISKDDVDMIEVPFKDLLKDIADRTDNKKLYFENIQNGNRYANNILHTHPRVFMSDTNIEDHYRFRFNNSYANTINEIDKGYFDIEADTKNMKGDFPEPGECPINAISFVNDNTKTIYVFLLRSKGNDQIKDFEQEVQQGIIDKELKEFIRGAVGGWKNEIRFGLDKFQFQFLMYDEEEEIKLIQDLFIAINTFKPDFLMAWNMSFDIPYIFARIKRLGYDPKDIVCHPDFKVKEADYFVDERNKNEYAERGDYAIISSYTVFVDQMIQFASRRKGQGNFISYGLDYIGEAVAKVRKLDYSHITTNFSEFAYKSYKTFVFYNIMDTLVQRCIESKVGDIDYLFSKCIANNTRYPKAHRQTVYLANRGAQEFYTNGGYIIGNNVNKMNEKPAEKFPGAFVGDPKKVSDYSKIRINDIPVNVFDNLDDFDYKSLYPSILREFNMAPNTQIGKVMIPEQIHDKENRFGIEKYFRSTEFMENLQSGVILEFCSRWFNLGGYEDLYDDLIEFYTKVQTPIRPVIPYTKDGLLVVINKQIGNTLIRPIIEGPIVPIIHYIPENTKLMEETRNAIKHSNNL